MTGNQPSLLWRPRKKTILVCVAILIALGCLGLPRLKEEEDILAFLPAQNPDVQTLRDVARRFGALRVAMIGVEPAPGQELFSSETLGRLERLSEALKNIDGVDRVVSLSTMTDLDGSAGGVDIRPLIPSPVPTDAAELARLRARALALPQVRGNVVSPDGQAALVLLFISEGAKTRHVAETARTVAQLQMGPARLYFGGAPFAGQSIYNETQADVRHLTPLALAVFLFIVIFAFRDWVAVVLTVGTVGLSVLLVISGMGLLREPFSVVSAMLPVILFAAGSQYAIHILGRYYLLRPDHDAPGAARAALRIAGPPTTIAAVATSLGFLSFLVMNIRPMRAFGLTCAVGIFLCWLLSMTLLPAVVVTWPRPYRRTRQLVWLEDRMEELWLWVQRRRIFLALCGMVLVILSVRYAAEVTVRMDPRAFFRPGSEPAQAQAFLDQRFGGSQFLQIAVSGDVLHPGSLRELRRLSNYARGLPGVTQVQSILDPLVLVGEAMGTGRGLPPERRQVNNLLFFLESEPSVRALLAADRENALINVRVSGDPRPIIKALERYLTQRFPYGAAPHILDELAEELSWSVPDKDREARRDPLRAALHKAQQQAAEPRRWLPPEVVAQAEQTAAREDDSGMSREERLQAALEKASQAAALRELDKVLTVSLEGTALVLTDLYHPIASEPVAAPLQARLSGEPLLDRGFSQAVEQNQWASLRVAMVAVFLVLLLFLRSLSGALLCMLPAALSLAVIFGALGFLHRPIDIGTSLVGSIVTGSGADFAMHYMWYLRRNAPLRVVRNVGPVILATALLLALGMGVLGLGLAPPIRLFGTLAAAGLMLSAAFTFLLVPALLPEGKPNQDSIDF